MSSPQGFWRQRYASRISMWTQRRLFPARTLWNDVLPALLQIDRHPKTIVSRFPYVVEGSFFFWGGGGGRGGNTLTINRQVDEARDQHGQSLWVFADPSNPQTPRASTCQPEEPERRKGQAQMALVAEAGRRCAVLISPTTIKTSKALCRVSKTQNGETPASFVQAFRVSIGGPVERQHDCMFLIFESCFGCSCLFVARAHAYT